MVKSFEHRNHILGLFSGITLISGCYQKMERFSRLNNHVEKLLKSCFNSKFCSVNSMISCLGMISLSIGNRVFIETKNLLGQSIFQKESVNNLSRHRIKLKNFQ